MRELTAKEMEQVDGGIAPWVGTLPTANALVSLLVDHYNVGNAS